MHGQDNLVGDAADNPEESPPLPVGYRFGSYLVREPIGRGGMARVYCAEHTGLNKLVALKVLHSSQRGKTAGHRRFLLEGRAAAAVKHPNVVDITDVGVWQGVPYLVMELLQGCDLETHLREHGALSDTELARLALPLTSGLAVAHDAGVVHRDLKPSNIFLARGADGDIVPKILDFGISKVVRGLQPELTATPYGEVMGTPLYLPPEGLAGTHDLTALSDQYSLGVVLYECATGRQPFQGPTLLSLLQCVAAGDYPPPSRFKPEMSAAVERAILRAMSLNPSDRFPQVRDFGRALWEVASPRTQLVWARAFGAELPDVTGGSLGRSASPTSGARRADSSSAALFGTGRVSAPGIDRGPTRRWAAGAAAVAALLLLLSAAGTAYFGSPRGAPLREATTVAGLNPVQERSAASSAPAPLVPAAPGPSEARRAPPATDVTETDPRPKRFDDQPRQAAEVAPRRVAAPAARVSVYRRAERTPVPEGRPRKAPSRSGADTELLRKAGAGTDDPEFPGLFRTDSTVKQPLEQASSPVGANEAPLLD